MIVIDAGGIAIHISLEDDQGGRCPGWMWSLMRGCGHVQFGGTDGHERWRRRSIRDKCEECQ